MNENRKYRGYFFTNMYLSTIQAGIQCAHAIGRMAREYNYIFNEWIENHETIILLNGGNCTDLDDLYDTLSRLIKDLNYDDSNPLPLVRFHEDKRSLNEATTCVGIILPDSIYDRNPGENFGLDDEIDEIEAEIYDLISKYQLVR